MRISSSSLFLFSFYAILINWTYFLELPGNSIIFSFVIFVPLSFYFIFWEIVSTSSSKSISCIIFYQVTYSYCPKIIYSFLNHAPFSQWKLVKSLNRVWLCDPVDCSLSGSSLHGILQARILEWVAISFSRGSSRPGIFLLQGIKPGSLALQADALTSEPPGKTPFS